jgi:hypothetical protein
MYLTKKNLSVFSTVFVVLGIFVISVFSCGSGDSKIINIVRNGKLSDYPENTVGEAIDSFFVSPKWEARIGQDGRNYVNATGDIAYMGKTVKTFLQFKVDPGDEAFEINGFEIDGVPQNMVMLTAFVEKMYGSIPAEAANLHDYAALNDLRNACTCQEAQFMDSNTYAKSVDTLKVLPRQSAACLDLSRGVTLHIITADDNHYVMEAFHKRGEKRYIVEGPGGTIREEKR